MAKNFGTPRGVRLGQWFKDRRALTEAYVHRPPQNGISGNGVEGADSIVVSGGYVDDEDHGDFLLYTGMGGNDRKTKRQIADQDPTASGNAGLIVSHRLGLPVRVVRGPHKGSAYAPENGYVYSGLYTVTDAWTEVGRDGFSVLRFRLDGKTGEFVLSSGEAARPESSRELDRIFDLIGREATALDRVLRTDARGVTTGARDRFAALKLLAALRVDRNGDKPERERYLQTQALLGGLSWDHDGLDEAGRIAPGATWWAEKWLHEAGLPVGLLESVRPAQVVAAPNAGHDQEVESPDSPPLLDALIDSPAYAAQRVRAGRAAPEPEITKRMLAALLRAPGGMSRSQLGQALRVSPARADSLIASLQRLTNIDGYEVVEARDDADRFAIDERLLREQFDLS